MIYNFFIKISLILHNLVTPTVLTEEVIQKNMEYISTSFDEKWIYYWDGDSIKGQEVKVSAAEQRAYLRKGRK